MLLDLQDAAVEQQELALGAFGKDRGALMSTIDHLNDRYGRGAIALASCGPSGGKRRWGMKQSLKTPDCTTRWSDVPCAPA